MNSVREFAENRQYRQCLRKVKYKTEAEARVDADGINAKEGTEVVQVYECDWCHRFHVGRIPRGNVTPSKELLKYRQGYAPLRLIDVAGLAPGTMVKHRARLYRVARIDLSDADHPRIDLESTDPTAYHDEVGVSYKTVAIVEN